MFRKCIFVAVTNIVAPINILNLLKLSTITSTVLIGKRHCIWFPLIHYNFIEYRNFEFSEVTDKNKYWTVKNKILKQNHKQKRERCGLCKAHANTFTAKVSIVCAIDHNF